MDMINSNYFSHTSPNYGSPFDMLKAFGVSYQPLPLEKTLQKGRNLRKK